MTMYPWMEPTEEVRESEQAQYARLVKQGQEAAALEAEGKHANVAWVQALKAAYPDLSRIVTRKRKDGSEYTINTGLRKWDERVYTAVMEARDCSRSAAVSFVYSYKSEARYAAKLADANSRTSTAAARARKIRSAVVELTTKWKLGADAESCMLALATMIEEHKNG